MHKIGRVSLYLFTAIALTLVSQAAFGWGFWSHRMINRSAVSLLPEPLRDFYRLHVDYVGEHSSDPDLRREKWTNEAEYHFMDMDDYGTYPNFKVPATYAEAVGKYGKETVVKDGMVPWRVGMDVDSLSAAMRAHDVPLVLHLSADLGHYVADMHVPLHATKNYNGQFTGNVGVHYRWETGIPERYGSSYSFTGIADARYIEHPVEHALHILTHSYSLLDNLFRADSLAKLGIPAKDLYKIETKNGRREYIYSEKYYKKFNTELNGMVEAQLHLATRAVASYWYTAWVDAGKPRFW